MAGAPASPPLCSFYSSEFWFPPDFDEEPTGSTSEYFEIGKMVCSVCPHNSRCAELGQDEQFGLWGGVTPTERKKGVHKPSKRLASREALELLPKKGERVDIKPLLREVRKVTTERPSVAEPQPA